MDMDLKAKLARSLRSATSDKETLNRQFLRLRSRFKEVEEALSHPKEKAKKE